MPPLSPSTIESVLTVELGADRATLDHLYQDLRMIAVRMMGRSSGHTLQPTALVHEAYLRLNRDDTVWNSRAHFLAVASIAMRQILVDHARRAGARKRGGPTRPLPLWDEARVDAGSADQVLEIDELLEQLAAVDPRRARVVHLKFFAGMTNAEIANVLDIARSTVADDWTVARAWLSARLCAAGSGP